MAHPSASLSLAGQITQLAQRIEQAPQAADQIAHLKDLVFRYLMRPEDGEDPRCHFFSSELREFGFSITAQKPQAIADCVRRILKAVRYLEKARIRPPLKVRPLDSNRVHLINIGKPLEDNNQQLLRACSKNLEQIADAQIADLFAWAQNHWDPLILNRILKRCPLPQPISDRLITTAFQNRSFEAIAYPVILLHFNSLAPAARTQISEWIAQKTGEIYHDLASDLTELEEALLAALDIPTHGFVAIHLPSCKEELSPIVGRITLQFSKAVEPNECMQTAAECWSAFLGLWEENAPAADLQAMAQNITPLLKESIRSMDAASFQKRIERLLASTGPATFKHLMVADLIRTLPAPLIERIIRWSDDNDEDDEIICFFIKNDLIPLPLLNAVANTMLRTNSFGSISAEIIPHKLHLLSPELQDRIAAWKMTLDPPTPRRSPYPEEKVDTTALFKALIEAARAKDHSVLLNLLRNTSARQLSYNEFEALATNTLDSPPCLLAVLSSPHAKLRPDSLMGMLEETLRRKNWDAVDSFMMTPSFAQLGPQRLLALCHLFDGAPESIALQYQRYLASFDDEPA